MFKNILSRFFPQHGARPARIGGDAPVPPAMATVIPEALRRYEAGDYAVAEAIASEAVRIDPRLHWAWNLLGAIAASADRNEQAVRHFERAIELAPANADYMSNCGEACRRAGWPDDAIDHCRGALSVDSVHTGALYNLALALHAIGEVEQAVATIRELLAIRPDLPAPRSALLFMLCHLPDTDGATLLAEHRRWSDMHARALAPTIVPRAVAHPPGRRLRVGFVSGDFRRHALAYFIEPVFANHDRAQFKFFCYSNTRRIDDVTDQLRSHVSQWRDITKLSDTAVAELVASDGIDILVDLSGHSADSRLLVFARKPAPVQISYVGYPNTTGLSTMDFRITDACMDPPGVADSMYTEKLLRTPHSLWCYRPSEGMPDVGPLPALKRGVTTFGSLHGFTKINREVIEVWARLLVRLPASELLIAVVPCGETGARLLASFAAHGIDAARVHLVGKLNFDAYLQLFHRVDIGLDAFPCVGGTTTCESLWMGVPVVTLAGSFGVARAGISLLTGAGLPELIADNPDHYIDIALDLARDPHKLAQLRGRLREQTRQSSLMNEAGFTRAFEALLRGAFDAVLARNS